ncbi:MAG TPA: cytochrome-c oxidase, cbb3-type subunit II [Bosea sp. (in: a-proteobacteria)]|jgi:cytochrome c oxidase cbb3-type subunit 2|uniref:cytochrome-c oxidase, cbb3-type subunit II n=1 Tax=Bosea sp. (in: a-proteobacteria) TaxID=1871050 RepID=UPI002E156F00|nr:cytochrome-c oxidase, cbb3-type subunit II [Bosea sp. (in: a-proteobacteria)]
MFGLHYRLERKTLGFVLAVIGVASIGGLVEIAPLFTINQTVEDAPDMRVYTPLEVAGRNIYIREGCYACHSQMIRTLRDEVERYGPYSLAVESKYDHPMLWGSKRTGPDLARNGGKYSDAWHVAHLNNPRDVVPVSIMPAYSWFLRTPLRTDDLGKHLRSLRAVGVPYTDEMIANASADAYGQAAPDSPFAEGVSKRYGEATSVRAFDGKPNELTEMDAVVAYLQILGRLTDAAHKPAVATETAPADTKSAEAKPAETKPAEATPSGGKP